MEIFFIWKQILKYSVDNQKDIIYVTHDQKEDWWQKDKTKQKTVGPRIELRKEFFEETGKNFYMYSLKSFLEHYSQYKGQSADKKVIEEVIQLENEVIKKTNDQLLTIKRRISKLQAKIDREQDTIDILLKKYENRRMPLNIAKQLKNTEYNMLRFKEELSSNLGKISDY